MPNSSQINHCPPLYHDGIGMYVHVPFCQTKCHYCDFNTYAGIESQISGYVDAVINELQGWSKLLDGPPVRTIFIGGGTPSYLPADDIENILNTIRLSYDVDEYAEVTMECNPGDVNAEQSVRWLRSGINRISMGVQSFDDGLLSMLGRRHTALQAQTAFKILRDTGFSNQSLDLIYGLPYQSLAQWTETVEIAIALNPDHISLYCLQVEKGTPLEVDISAGLYPVPNDDLAADMYEKAQIKLADSGFVHYEISNWAKIGFESKHNLIYWNNEPYLGVGPGAHSWLSGRRFANLKSPRRYVTSVADHYESEGLDPVALMRNPSGPVEQVDIITPISDIAETMMMGMRLNAGVKLSRFYDRFGATLDSVFPSELHRLIRMNLIELKEDAVRLSDRGRLLGNEVFAEFLIDA